jgi:hypothetical protein
MSRTRTALRYGTRPLVIEAGVLRRTCTTLVR